MWGGVGGGVKKVKFIRPPVNHQPALSVCVSLMEQVEVKKTMFFCCRSNFIHPTFRLGNILKALSTKQRGKRHRDGREVDIVAVLATAWEVEPV